MLVLVGGGGGVADGRGANPIEALEVGRSVCGVMSFCLALLWILRTCVCVCEVTRPDHPFYCHCCTNREHSTRQRMSFCKLLTKDGRRRELKPARITTTTSETANILHQGGGEGGNEKAEM